MIERVLQKIRTAGFRGLIAAMARRVFRRRSQPPFDPMPVALDTIFAGDDFTIVQVGAFIGDSFNDPLFARVRAELQKGRGRLICVEPVKEHFYALVRNYGDVPHVICENVAIADHNGEAAFYRLGVDPVAHGFPDWLAQLGSLKKERMESLWDKCEENEQLRNEGSERLKAFYLQHRVAEMVPCMTLSELLRRHHIGSVDLLQIDTEGYDLEILATIDFSKTPIRFVNYEWILLHERKPDAEQLMQGHGYLTLEHGHDTFCYRAGDRRLMKRRRG